MGRSVTHLHLPFDKAGDVVLVVEDRQGVQQVLLQPVPVLVDLLQCRTWIWTDTCVRKQKGPLTHELTLQLPPYVSLCVSYIMVRAPAVEQTPSIKTSLLLQCGHLQGQIPPPQDRLADREGHS